MATKFHPGKTDPTFCQILEPLPADEYDAVPLERVYFALDPDNGQIKIGRSRDVERRIGHLRHAHGRPGLELLGSLAGGERLEGVLLDRFQPYCRQGREWFSAEIAPLVEKLLAA